MKSKTFDITLSVYQAGLIEKGLSCYLANNWNNLPPEIRDDMSSLTVKFGLIVSDFLTPAKE